jgi:hypothetical protein
MEPSRSAFSQKALSSDSAARRCEARCAVRETRGLPQHRLDLTF